MGMVSVLSLDRWMELLQSLEDNWNKNYTNTLRFVDFLIPLAINITFFRLEVIFVLKPALQRLNY